MFTANTNFKVPVVERPSSYSHLHQFSNTIPVEGLERIHRQDAFFDVFHQEVTFGIVTAVTKGHLGQVIGTKGEEFSYCGDFTGGDSSTWNFDHCAEFVRKFNAFFLHHFSCNSFKAGLDPFEFIDGARSAGSSLQVSHERHAWCNRRRLQRWREPAFQRSAAWRSTAVHRARPIIGLDSCIDLDGFEQGFLFFKTLGFTFYPHGNHFFQKGFFRRQEFMQRGIDQANDDRVTVHRFEDTVKV